jgi:hypothetical protein
VSATYLSSVETKPVRGLVVAMDTAGKKKQGVFLPTMESPCFSPCSEAPLLTAPSHIAAVELSGGRQAEVAKSILSAKNVPYTVAAPLLIQDMAGWDRDGIGGLQASLAFRRVFAHQNMTKSQETQWTFIKFQVWAERSAARTGVGFQNSRDSLLANPITLLHLLGLPHRRYSVLTARQRIVKERTSG